MMKSFRDYEPSVQCDECDKYLLIGDNPNSPILETCDDCIKKQKMFENFDTSERLEEVIMWITNDFWHELSNESKVRVIKQLGYMGYPTDDLEEHEDEKF